MFQDSDERTEVLLEEAMGLKGMIAEVRSKSLILKFRMHREQADQFESGNPMFPSRALCEDVKQSITQMRDDLAKYSQRLREIYEELASYGIISDV